MAAHDCACGCSASNEQKTQVPRRLLAVRQMVEQNMSAAHSLKDLAAIAGTSVSQLCRDFQRYYQTSPQQWIIRQRLDFAVELLQSSQLTLERIAKQCGFCDRFYLSKMLRKHYGVSPKQLRSVNNIN